MRSEVITIKPSLTPISLIKTSKTTQKPFCPFLSKASFANRLTANKLVSIVKGIWCKNPYGAAQLSQGSSNLNCRE